MPSTIVAVPVRPKKHPRHTGGAAIEKGKSKGGMCPPPRAANTFRSAIWLRLWLPPLQLWLLVPAARGEVGGGRAPLFARRRCECTFAARRRAGTPPGARLRAAQLRSGRGDVALSCRIGVEPKRPRRGITRRAELRAPRLAERPLRWRAVHQRATRRQGSTACARARTMRSETCASQALCGRCSGKSRDIFFTHLASRKNQPPPHFEFSLLGHYMSYKSGAADGRDLAWRIDLERREREGG